MRSRLPLTLCAVLVVGCSGSSSPTLFSPVREPPPVPVPLPGSFQLPQSIQVGDTVDVAVPKGGRNGYHFSLTAPRDATLVARVTWEATNDFLQLWVGSTMFGAHFRNGDEDPDTLTPYMAADGQRSVVGSVPVVGGSSYRIWVASVPGYWDDGGYLSSSFTLTTSIE